MDAISTTPEPTNNRISTRDILLACITHRLEKYADAIPDSFKEVIQGCLRENRAVKEIGQSVMNYVKILSPPGRTYKRCGAERHAESKQFIQYLEQHPTYTLSQSHNNNVTWYQIAEIIQFTVDLVEECYKAGRTELVQFLVDWCVSFINQQSCIYTSDGWVDLLMIPPQVWSLQSRTAPTYSLSISAEESNLVKEEHPISVSSSGQFSGISSERTYLGQSDRGSCDVDVQSWREESEIHQEELSKSERKDQNFKNEPIKGARFGEKTLMKNTGSSTTYTAPAVTCKDKKLSLLRCSCGKENKVRNGNFMGLCDSNKCGQATCLLCCTTISKKNSARHVAWHKVNLNSTITKEHIDKNTELFTATCFNCGNRGCIKNSARQQLISICKLCNTYFCTHPGCGEIGNYRVIKYHLDTRHSVTASASKEQAFISDENFDKSKELHLLRCGCKNIENVERHGKFLCKCGIPSCDYYHRFICLICGRTNIGDRGLNCHLGLHETDCDGQVNEKHVEANLKLYNKVCGKCGQKSSGQYSTASRQTTAKCRCCNVFLCMFPGCKMYYMINTSVKHHYSYKHCQKNAK